MEQGTIRETAVDPKINSSRNATTQGIPNLYLETIKWWIYLAMTAVVKASIH